MPADAAAITPLSDPEISELDDLLAAIPEPLEALDVVMLDGYLCGVLAQPVLVDAAEWLPPALDWNWGDPDQPGAGHPLTPETPGWHAAKHERLLSLVSRHHAVLERQLREEAWFDPIVMEPDDEQGRPLEGAAAIGPALAAWAVGFEHALNHFPALESLTDGELPDLLACLRRHLPEQEGEEMAYTKALDAEHPLRTLTEAIGDLVENIVAICDLARGERLKVETVRRVGPKVGRNDPCPCGSGRKFKQCHGNNDPS